MYNRTVDIAHIQRETSKSLLIIVSNYSESAYRSHALCYVTIWSEVSSHLKYETNVIHRLHQKTAYAQKYWVR